MRQVLVVGAGISGLTTAYFLHKNGYKVTVVDSGKIASDCSFANGGQFSACNSEVWTKWSNIWNGIKWLSKEDAPLKIRPTFDMLMFKWLFDFIKNTIKGDWVDRTCYTALSAVKSKEYYNQIIQDTGIQFDEYHCGILQGFHNFDDYVNSLDTTSILETCGVESINEYDFGVDQIKNFTVYNSFDSVRLFPNDSVGDIYKFCVELSNWLKSKCVEILEDTFINPAHIEHDMEGKFIALDILDRKDYVLEEYIFDDVVFCNGVGINQATSFYGDKEYVYPVKGYSITINLDDTPREYWPEESIIDGSKKIVCSRLGNRFRVAGTAELTGFDRTITKSRIEPLVDWVRQVFPEVVFSTYEEYACLRPMTASMLPFVKESEYQEGVWYVGGHGHLGWTLGAFTGHQMASLFKDKYKS